MIYPNKLNELEKHIYGRNTSLNLQLLLMFIHYNHCIKTSTVYWCEMNTAYKGRLRTKLENSL